MTLTSVFLQILRMSLTGGAVVLAALLVRLGLRKAPKIFSYALWAAVLFRLLCPFGIPVSVRIPPAAQTAAAQTGAGEEPAAPYASVPLSELPRPADTAFAPSALPAALPETATPGDVSLPEAPEPSESLPAQDSREILLRTGAVVWLTGAVLLVLWNGVSLLRLRRRLVGAVPLGDGVYLADHIGTAFVWGLFFPKIILPSSLDRRERSYVVRHERTHIRRGDPLWRLLAFAALALHWFNPLVWLAFRLSGKDMEMSCDEAVVRTSPTDIRADYSETLLRFSSGGTGVGTALAFGEGETGSRVKNVMRYKRPVLWTTVAAAVVLVSAAVVFAVNPMEKDTRLPNKDYTVSGVLYYEEGNRVMIHRVELAGDDSLYAILPDSESGWFEYVGQAVERTDEARTLMAAFSRKTGVKLKTVADARFVKMDDPDMGWLIFNTVSGDVYLASVRFEDGKVFWLRELIDQSPKSTLFRRISGFNASFCDRSLTQTVGREVTSFAQFTKDGMGDYVLVLFTAGDDLGNVVFQSEDPLPVTPGLALFERFDGNRAMRLVCWSLAEGVTAAERSWALDMTLEDGIFTFSLPDGTALSAEAEIPRKSTTLFGRTATEGEGKIRFLVPADEITTEGTETRAAFDAEQAEQQRIAEELNALREAGAAAEEALRADIEREQRRLTEDLTERIVEMEAAENEIFARMTSYMVQIATCAAEQERCRQELDELLLDQPEEKMQKVREAYEREYNALKAEEEAAYAQLQEAAALQETYLQSIQSLREALAQAEIEAAGTQATDPSPSGLSETDSADGPGEDWWESRDVSGTVFPLPEGTDYTVSSEQGWRMRYGQREYHLGTDFACAEGTEVLAMSDGTVTQSGYHYHYGDYVVVNHEGGLATVYAHLSERLVSVGDTVEAGDVVGKVGMSGAAYSNHLHFEVRSGSTVRNPREFLDF